LLTIARSFILCFNLAIVLSFLLRFAGFVLFGVWCFNLTFNNISVISWRLVLLLEETRVPGKNHWPVASHWQTLSHNVVSSTPGDKQGSNSQLQFFDLQIQPFLQSDSIDTRCSNEDTYKIYLCTSNCNFLFYKLIRWM
jgi:hypothetical protein